MLAHDQRVAARDGRVVEAHVGGEAAADADRLHAIIEEGDRWECPECWARFEAAEK